MLEQLWGTPDMIGVLLPSYAADPVAVEWHGRILRGGCTPRSFAQQTEALFGVDARPALSHIRCPVLSLSTAGSVMPPPAVSRYMADHVADGEYLEVAGPDLDIWASPDSREILDRIETYATGRVAAAGTDRVLAAVLFTDIVGSTERLAEIGDLKWKSVLDRHDLRAQGIVERWRGRIVDTAGDGVLAMFDGPGAALRAALEFQAAMAVDDIHLRAGVHFGEVELRTGGEVGGLAVHLAARVMSLAGASELYCTRTVKELALGADVDFVDCGEQALKGIPEPWQVFRVAQAH
jgi:class 3 adenylate cyclase